MCHQFDPHKNKQQGYPGFQQIEAFDHLDQHEEKGSKAEDGEDIGKEYDVWITCDPEYGWNGVEGKDEVRKFVV